MKTQNATAAVNGYLDRMFGETRPGNRGYREIGAHAFYAGINYNESQYADHLEAAAAMGFLVGRAWPAGGGKAHAALMDHAGGSAGLHELVMEWAKEFIRQLGAEPAGDGEQDYASHLYTFAMRKFDQLREAAQSAA